MNLAQGRRDAAPLSLAAALLVALGLSMAAALSLGITRFSFAMLLPPMRGDLGWSYTLAGGMNTANAIGYLLGALTTPMLMRRFGPTRLLTFSAALACLFMATSGFFVAAAPLLVQRLLAGLPSAWVFVAGGLLAARLGTLRPAHSGLLLGMYYGGTGFGIVLAAVLVPAVLASAEGQLHAWRWAWWALAVGGVVATAVAVWASHALDGHLDAAALAPAADAKDTMRMSAVVRRFGWALAGYVCFGAGYIAYMTFVIALFREQGASGTQITVFYSLLGIACLASSRIWAQLLDRWRGGGPQALLEALLGVATLLPIVSTAWPLALLSGVVFGGVFLSVVASTTAIVRHNLPRVHWTLGISAFTIAFALGQIIGPTVTGYIADGPGGLSRGLLASTATLWVAALLASRQKPLAW
ncbi:MAG: transporter [Rhizobacter sp.]|nr:transporter [Rhizobacter sp.]